MKNFLLVSLASLGLVALAGCSDDTAQHTTSSTSVTMSSDSKNMTGNTVTTTDVPPPEVEPTKEKDESDNGGYPAIHSNGQH